ncbi:hypothetical protein H6G00_01590 [Leptolyngbya sp. FACHB-541]|uniref:hypothetical protein n=1 Tax=Leptolyngbya sp. FACHB-541 TaxID=2692810 RepID=UPI0016834FAC|nr:hypothetical protein [Leptolyngbya sp. FACHB-541]MBD1995323.1 hypothetical protein [Leptolyngbya sp. FACHB-541]
MSQILSVDQIIEFVRPHLNELELAGFERHAKGDNPGSGDIEQAGGWMLYWGFSDAIAHCRTFSPLVDSYYERGYELGDRFLNLKLKGKTMSNAQEPTTERLARAMEQADCPTDMIARARAGYYDDYKSELAMPCQQLVADLRAIDKDALVQRAIDGEFDGTPAESEAWFQQEGQYFLVDGGIYPKQPKRPKPKGFG